jgi:hypothetical protein
MRNIDPLIRREFERLGINIVENDSLADLVITKVNHQRVKGFLLAGFGAVLILVLTVTFLRADNSGQNRTVLNAGSSLSYTQETTNPAVSPLPQAGYRDIDGSSRKGSAITYTFELKQGWIIQEITDNPDPIMGEAGKVEVFKIDGDSQRLVQQYSMSSRTQINEFGVPQDGVYKFVLTFTNPNFKGRVRIAFVRSL